MTDQTFRRHRARPVDPPGRRRGLGIGEFHLEGGFWGTRQRTNARATLQHCHDWMERLGWLANFDRAASGGTGADRPGWSFSDSEVYKLLEAIAWEVGRTGDPAMESMWESLVDRVAAAQDGDGYLSTCYGHPGRPGRYTDLSAGHELYCLGHLFQAAVARIRTHGPDRLVDVARRAADHVCREFGPEGRVSICGHPGIEAGLVELGRALGEPRYIEQAQLFVDRRGHGTLPLIPLRGSAYFQDDVPVRQAQVLRGHAVRALYLAAGAMDVAVTTGDRVLQDAIERQWVATVERRTYITGGMGSRHQDEAFGDDWELPPDRAYCETCAGVASVMLSWRLLLTTDDVRYADLAERTFFNVVAASPRSDGQAFFYANPLQQREPGTEVRPDAVNPRAEGGVRAPWFDVSCCPTNVARTLASWHTYAATVEQSGGQALVTLSQYAAGDLRISLDDGQTVVLRVDTAYPDEGTVRVEVVDVPASVQLTLRLRVPDWADGATLVGTYGGPDPVAPGWATVPGMLSAEDVVTLAIPVSPRLTRSDPRVDAVRGTVAIERGPLVLCLESVDLPEGIALEQVRVRLSGEIRPVGDGASVRARAVSLPGRDRSALPFHPVGAESPPDDPLMLAPGDAGDDLELTLVPYHRWAERGPSTMRVFLPTD
ncbi:MAG TPA: glycoside hydrolase family 127 protein [Candidatus Ruania gallistercoris]|uniref:Glycoside hydrolase family 127 protein n=1 Tax=Candidatus Ruania gallistercoris TaxID=2838746 RepID=A0A9D2EB74_9MICO|nr:glycoside hydrolase family 127 protein [Candidatus Ruania gallistercoris]